MPVFSRKFLVGIVFVFVCSTLTVTVAIGSPPTHDTAVPVEKLQIEMGPRASHIIQCMSPGCVRHLYDLSKATPKPVTAPAAVAVPTSPVKSTPTKHLKTKTPVKAEPVPQVAPSPNSHVETAIAFALAQLGKPYVYGAAGPRAYDCSGLVMVAFSKIGLRLPHFTGALIKLGSGVSKAAMQRGDIVFPQSGHVGIYLGGGMMVHAPQSGDVVKVSKVYAFYAARRLV